MDSEYQKEMIKEVTENKESMNKGFTDRNIFNPLSPKSDQHQISPHKINAW